MWIVTLHFDGSNSYIPTKSWSKDMCASETERGAHNAGKYLIDIYNFPELRLQDAECFAGIIHHEMVTLDYSYTVREHIGEYFI